MTKNEPDVECKKLTCYGVVNEYSSDGDRDIPERYNMSLVERIKHSLFNEEITWHECSVCHEPHFELDE